MWRRVHGNSLYFPINFTANLKLLLKKCIKYTDTHTHTHTRAPKRLDNSPKAKQLITEEGGFEPGAVDSKVQTLHSCSLTGRAYSHFYHLPRQCQLQHLYNWKLYLKGPSSIFWLVSGKHRQNESRNIGEERKNPQQCQDWWGWMGGRPLALC